MSSTVAPPVEKPVEVLKKVGSGGERELRGAKLLFKGEQAGLEDDLYDGSVAVCQLHYPANVLFDELVVGRRRAFEQADVENHVDVMSTLFDHSSGLVALGGGECGSEGKSDDDADGHSRALERGDGGLNPDGVDHRAGESMLGRLVAELKDLIAAGVGLQDGVDRVQRRDSAAKRELERRRHGDRMYVLQGATDCS